MTRQTVVSVARGSGWIGSALWCLAALYCLVIVASGFVRWDEPNIYVTSIFVAFGLVVNVCLLRCAADARRFALMGLLVASILLSAVIVVGIAFMATGT